MNEQKYQCLANGFSIHESVASTVVGTAMGPEGNNNSHLPEKIN